MFGAISRPSADLSSLKADLVLNAFRDQLNAGISLQGLVAGFADEFEDATGIDGGASVNYTYDAAGDFCHNPGNPVQIPQVDGVAIGSLTDFAALSTAFDGVSVQLRANSTGKNPSVTGLNNFIGKDWGVGVTNTISKFIAYGTSDPYPLTLGGNAVKLQGSTDNFAASIVDLWSGNGTGAAGEVLTIDTGIDVSTAYRYHRLAFEGNSAGGGVYCAEVEFFEAGVVPDMTLVLVARTALTAPNAAFVVIWHEDVDAVVLNDDLTVEVSRNGGVNWTPGALSEISILSTGRLLVAAVDLSGQPSDVSMVCRISTLNKKSQKVHAFGMDWG